MTLSMLDWLGSILCIICCGWGGVGVVTGAPEMAVAGTAACAEAEPLSSPTDTAGFLHTLPLMAWQGTAT